MQNIYALLLGTFLVIMALVSIYLGWKNSKISLPRSYLLIIVDKQDEEILEVFLHALAWRRLWGLELEIYLLDVGLPNQTKKIIAKASPWAFSISKYTAYII